MNGEVDNIHFCYQSGMLFITLPSGRRLSYIKPKLGTNQFGSECISKADVSVNIYTWLKAQRTGKPVELCCAIGDDTIDGLSYSEIVETARAYIQTIGGFEKFAEWGLVR